MRTFYQEIFFATLVFLMKPYGMKCAKKYCGFTTTTFVSSRINVCKKHEKSNIRPVLSLQDSSGTCPEVPPGPEGQARPDLCPTFEYSRYLVFPRDLNYFCIANLNGYLANFNCARKKDAKLVNGRGFCGKMHSKLN